MAAQGTTSGDPNKVDVAGDTMTGPLTLDDGSPAASQQYVADHSGGGGGGSGTPSNTVVPATAYGASSAPGAASAYSRGDHNHGTPALPTPAAIGASAVGHTHAATGGTTSGYVWNGSAYALANPHRISAGPSLPAAPNAGDVWFNTAAGSAVVAGFSTATSLPVDLTSGGVAHVPGSWVEMVASTAVAYGMVTVLIPVATSVSGNTRSVLLDVGVGASGSEVPIIQDLDIGRCGYAGSYPIPVVVPAGSRVSMRIQARETALTVRAQLALSRPPTYAVYIGGAWQYAGTGATATAYGITDASSVPNALTLAGAINTWSAWTDLAASTAAALRYLLVLPSGPVGANWGAVNANALADIGVGPLGSEVSILGGGLAYRWTTAEATERLPLLVSCNIPAGSRLVARYQADSVAIAPALSVIGVS